MVLRVVVHQFRSPSINRRLLFLSLFLNCAFSGLFLVNNWSFSHNGETPSSKVNTVVDQNIHQVAVERTERIVAPKQHNIVSIVSRKQYINASKIESKIEVKNNFLQKKVNKLNEMQIVNKGFKTKQLPVVDKIPKSDLIKIILFYNPPGWMKFSSSASFDSCEYKKCKFSTDRNDFQKSDAVVFDGTRLPPMPDRKPGQVWIYENIESPANTLIPGIRWKNVFNWTSTYRRDSDFMAPYRFVVKGGSASYTSISKASIYLKNNSWHLNNNTISKLSDIIKNKSKNIAWFVSNCITSSRREEYVQRLRQYMAVDTYGGCGILSCSSDKEEECRQMLTEKYKFYLAFENSFCRDYITEKALVNLKKIVIPIVRGLAFYDLYMPPNSYIDTKNFPSVKDLARFLSNLADNHELYDQFQKWHTSYHVEENHMFHDARVMCKVCKHLHEKEHFKRVYDDIHDWWHGNVDYKAMCENPRTVSF